MISINRSLQGRQRGIALVSALLIMLVITILGMAMFRGYGLQQRLGGNTREKSRAFHAATASQNYAEWYLTGNNGANAATTTNCSGKTAADYNTPMVCSNAIPTTVAQPDTWGAAFTYTPPNMSTAPGAQGSYAQVPQFYISFIGSPGAGPAYNSVLGQNNTLFQVDAAGWGGTAQTVAVVESTFKVSSISTSIPPSASNVVQKNVYLGGP